MNRGLSVYLDLVRVGAAIVVLVTHLAYTELSGGMLAPWRLLGNDAVMVFFVLSGYVIAHVAATREDTPRDYMLSRLARLWSVALPALAVTMVLDRTGAMLSPLDYSVWWYQDAWPAVRVLTALSFTNELWFLSIRPFSNGPYWSLGYEFWYYAIFAAWIFLKGARRAWVVLALCLLVGPKILLLFPIWLLGVWVYRRNQAGGVGLRVGAALFFGSLALYALFRWSGAPAMLLAETQGLLGKPVVDGMLRFSNEFAASYIIGPLVAAHFVGAFALSRHLERWTAPAAPFIRWLAQSTFTIYLVHYPVLRFIGAVSPYDRTSPLAVALVFATTLLACIGMAMVTERQKGPLRAWLDRGWPRPQPATP